MGETATQTIGAIERATTVLQLFIDMDQPSLGVTEIANALDLSKAVVHRVLASLRTADLITLEPESRRYSLGPTALALGLAYIDRIDIRTLARPSLRRLSEQTRETATLSVRYGDQRVYIDQVTPPTEVKMTVSVGQPFPLHAGSSSKAFLAFLPDEEQERYLEQELLSLTDRTITDPERLRNEIATISKRGFARSLGERQADAASIAAPIFDHRGTPVAVMSICGPLERFKPEADTAARLLLDETRELSRKLGFR
jgi:DNA-binding IclR family transcriptional regulator